MPVCVVKSLDLYIGNERCLCVEILSVQSQSERLSHRAAPTVAANKVFRGHQLSGRETDLHAALACRHLLECRTKVNLPAKLGQSLSQDLLRAILRNQPE